ncbi:MAG: signal recognition particle-docking protein FtsY [Candidatus Polarisedimenticolaceae bacterium]|nr:signal recognition particle-docking protein FtsY [Candidatus Polarisedimenticolaceae bacterium]
MFGFGRRKRKKQEAEAAAKAAAEEAAKKLAEEAAASEAEVVEELIETQPEPEAKPAATEEATTEAPSDEIEQEPSPTAVEIASTEESVAPEPTQEAATEPTPERKPGFFKRLKKSLTRTRSNFTDGLANLVLGRKEIDDELLEELETLLLIADVGVEATTRIISDLNGRVRRKELSNPNALSAALKTQLQDILQQSEKPVRQPSPGKPQVILMIGINGAGKTTTIGKLAKQLQEEGNSVMLAAGDTFRAAAVEQLQAWGERNRIPVIAQHTGADSASVIFDGLQAATARGIDVLIADTAGRLHTKSNLMDELAKIARVMQKIDPDAPHEVMLVVDATTGQNALNQAVQFNETIPITGITLTKLDGTAKGGILFAIANRMQIPIRFIGVGEAIEDLRHFNAKEFVDALFEE